MVFKDGGIITVSYRPSEIRTQPTSNMRHSLLLWSRFFLQENDVKFNTLETSEAWVQGSSCDKNHNMVN